ncbi:hypothetical protein K7I13_01355 [Brucepastera parasyntrophica]|uniref:GGDEF domain-containing protein n=1 Tax=Brucepastera parasyntrophica TaxID=2880008 RepID=UPI00210BAFFF|nr:diguanylate cyclase [Brucepastera parasyntrophica]ULQ60010.1 hypothetical protein K7I13_01355 [Brucepastera parasyntrophica]
MKDKFIAGYSVVAFCILLATILWFTLSIHREIQTGTVEAERTFTWISREIVSASYTEGFLSSSFYEKIVGVCRNSRLLNALVISTPVGGPVFLWPDNSPAIAYDVTGRPYITETSPFMKNHSANIEIDSGQNSGTFTVTAVLYVLHPDVIYNTSKNCFFVISVLFLATLIVILANSSKKKAPANINRKTGLDITEDISLKPVAPVIQAPVQEKPAEVISPEPPEPAAEVSVNQEIKEPPVPDIAETPVEDIPAEPPVESTVESVQQPQPVEIDTVADVHADSEPESGNENAAEPEPKRNEPAEPTGLFSPTTGIGWEQYLEDRLDAELVRAASSEQDLSLIIIRIPEHDEAENFSKNISRLLLDTFKFRDMLFEFGPDSFAVILQNMNLDQAMKTANTLFSDLSLLLEEMNISGKVSIGITTRTGRLLPAYRMIEEAYNASKKADGEENLPIVAFRANPEKYRSFVAEQEEVL